MPWPRQHQPLGNAEPMFSWNTRYLPTYLGTGHLERLSISAPDEVWELRGYQNLYRLNGNP